MVFICIQSTTPGVTVVDQRVGVVKARIEHQRAACFVVGRRQHAQFEHEAVARGGRQFEGFFALDAVAVGEHRHVRKAVFAVERRQRALGHRTQQQRLHLRPGTVDFIEEEGGQALAVAQQRTRLDARLAVAVYIGVIDEIVRHQVDRAFDTLEVAAHGAGKGAQHRRLADTDVAFEQHMAAREQRHVDQAKRVVLTDDRPPHFFFDAQRKAAPIMQSFLGEHQQTF
jgi:hypothetical protein